MRLIAKNAILSVQTFLDIRCFCASFQFYVDNKFRYSSLKMKYIERKVTHIEIFDLSLYLCMFYLGKKPSATDIENCLYYSKTLRSDEIQLNLDSNPVPLVTIILFDNHATIVWHKKSYLEFFSPNIKIFLHFFIGPCICR